MPPRIRLTFQLALLFWSTLAAPAFATTVVPPSFEELVTESALIARVQVKKTEALWFDTDQGRVIKTMVTFSVIKVLKGTAVSELTLPFLGGERDGEGMRVHGMPTFATGDLDVVFISDRLGVRFCPLVAMMHGRYPVRVDAETGRSYVTRNDGSLLERSADVQLPHVAGLATMRPQAPSRALDLPAFEADIEQAVRSGITSQPSTR